MLSEVGNSKQQMSPFLLCPPPPLVPYSMCVLSCRASCRSRVMHLTRAELQQFHTAAGQKALRNSHPLQALPIYIGIPLTSLPLFPESPSFLPDLETTVEVRVSYLGMRGSYSWESVNWDCFLPGHLDCPERPLGVGGGTSCPHAVVSSFHPILLLSKFTSSKKLLRLDGARLPSWAYRLLTLLIIFSIFISLRLYCAPAFWFLIFLLFYIFH